MVTAFSAVYHFHSIINKERNVTLSFSSYRWHIRVPAVHTVSVAEIVVIRRNSDVCAGSIFTERPRNDTINRPSPLYGAASVPIFNGADFVRRRRFGNFGSICRVEYGTYSVTYHPKLPPLVAVGHVPSTAWTAPGKHHITMQAYGRGKIVAEERSQFSYSPT